jgi:hypothetical protein
MAVIPGRMRRQLAIGSGQLSIPIDLVGVFGVRNQNAVVVSCACRRLNLQMPPVPRKTCIRGMALRAPRIIHLDRLPMRVVVGGLRPAGIVPQMKLPFAIDRHSALANAHNHHGGRRLRSGVWRGIRGGLLAS